jgi:serine/threonine protein kinase
LLFTAEIGHGSSATVFKGLYKGQTVAIKVISFKPSKKLSRDKQIRDLREEFNIMSVLQSKHIIFFHGLVVEPRLCMILELCEQGSLYDVLNISADEAISNNTPAAQLDWPTLFHWFTQAVNGVEALHSWKPPIVHRDVKTLNLLINSQNEVKVADFGLSRFLESDQTLSTLGRLRGTYAYW